MSIPCSKRRSRKLLESINTGILASKDKLIPEMHIGGPIGASHINDGVKVEEGGKALIGRRRSINQRLKLEI